MSWPRVQRACCALRAAEQAAAASWDSGSWARPQIELRRPLAAGRRTRLAERDPRRRCGPGGLAAGTRRRRVRTGPRPSAPTSAAVQQAVEAILFQFPDRVREAIRSLSASAEAHGDLAATGSLLDDLAQALELLDHPSPVRLPELRRVRRELERGRQPWAERNPGDAAIAAPAGEGESPVTTSLDDQHRRLGEIANLYGRWLQILAGERFRDEPFPAVLAAVRRLAAAGSGSKEYWTACRQLGEDLRDFQRRLPALVERLTLQNSDLTDPAARPERILRLREAQRLLVLIHPWDVARLTGPGPAQCCAAPHNTTS